MTGDWKELTLEKRRDRVRRATEDHDIRHSLECRQHNPKGAKRHLNGCLDELSPNTISMFGGYHCICDLMERVENVMRTEEQ